MKFKQVTGYYGTDGKWRERELTNDDFDSIEMVSDNMLCYGDIYHRYDLEGCIRVDTVMFEGKTYHIIKANGRTVVIL